MSVHLELERVKEWGALRGFSNLYRKEYQAWWGTRRWWINLLLWTGLLSGLVAIMLFVPNQELAEASEAEIAAAGGALGFILMVALNVFFEFGVPILAIGTIVLAQDLIIGERQSGITAWLLSKPVARRAYILTKVVANSVSVISLMIAVPATVTFGLLSLRLGEMYPILPFLSAVAVMSVHTLFYLAFTLMLGTIFDSRGPVVGIALASVLGGGMLGGFIDELLYVGPWALPKVALLTATEQPIPDALGLAAPVATALWSLLFVAAAVVKFEKIEC